MHNYQEQSENDQNYCDLKYQKHILDRDLWSEKTEKMLTKPKKEK